jgi:hypothetical protein
MLVANALCWFCHDAAHFSLIGTESYQLKVTLLNQSVLSNERKKTNG